MKPNNRAVDYHTEAIYWLYAEINKAPQCSFLLSTWKMLLAGEKNDWMKYLSITRVSKVHATEEDADDDDEKC